MSAESEFIAALRKLARHPAARGLLDDAAVLPFGGRALVLTHDVLAEGVHFLPTDPPADVARKLIAVNLSDLAAKGARPLGVLLGYTLSETEWDQAFAAGLGKALSDYSVPLLGGDTIAMPSTPRIFGLTAIGEAPAGGCPPRSGAKPGDHLFVTGTIGDAGLGLEIAAGRLIGPDVLLAAYRKPTPRLREGGALAARATAMMDVSDGLLIDASRMAQASGAAIEMDLARLPLSPAFTGLKGNGRDARLWAAAAGDDYELLFSATADPADFAAEFRSASVPVTWIGTIRAGEGLRLVDDGHAIPLPSRLGYEHEAFQT